MRWYIWGGGAAIGVKLLAAVVLASVTVFAGELVHRGFFHRALRWVAKQPARFAANVLLLLSVEGLLWFLTGYMFISIVIVTAFFYFLVGISYFKHVARNEPLYASDFRYVIDVFTVADGSNFPLRPENVLPAIFLGLLLVLAAPTGEIALPGMYRGICFVMSLVLFFAVVYTFFDLRKQDFTYMRTGFLMGLVFNFLFRFSHREVARPQAELADAALAADAERPDVIVVQSESFWDMTKLKNIEFSEDPVPFYRELSSRSASGNLVVSVFGGGTCNVEAEVLLGVVGRHFNVSDPFYRAFVKQPVPSLVSAFQSFGYDATALHTFVGSFYGRDQAFKHMGFDAFHAEDSLREPVRSGRYCDDSNLTDMIMETLDAQTDKPSFIYAISMENHQPYKADKFKETKIRVSGENIGKIGGVAETYAHGLRDADAELKRLVAYCEKREKPTVLLFFGDHLGALGSDFALYRHSELVKGETGELTPADVANLYTPPFLLWSNVKADTTQYGDIGANFLGKLLLDFAGLPKPMMFGYLDEVWQKAHCLSRTDYFVDGEGAVLQHMTPDMRAADGAYQAISYQMMGLRSWDEKTKTQGSSAKTADEPSRR